MKIYHNPRCTKSRQTLAILKDKGIKPEVVKYLEDTPSTDELRQIIELLGIKPEDLVRKNETVYKEKFKNKELSEDGWIEAMVQNPKLIQRPIVIKGNKAIIGRPPEKVLELLQ